MSYNKARELKKWQEWKQQEEILLRSLDVDESVIKQLRKYDYQMFLSDRRIRSRQVATMDTFFLNKSYYDKKEIRTIEDLLDDIKNESLYIQLSKSDPKTLNILLLRILGYSFDEIAIFLGMNKAMIYNRMHRLRKKIKKI